MGQTDRQTDKTTRWAFTAYEPQWELFKEMPDIVKEWGWQTEKCPDTGRQHYQGYLLTRTQQRFSAMRKALPGVHIEAARNWSALLNYCKKTESAVEGTQVREVNERKYLKFSDALMRIANAYVLMPHVDGQKYDEWLNNGFNSAVRTLLLINDEDISLYSNPQLKSAWRMSWNYWLRKAQHSQAVCELATGECEWCAYQEAIMSQQYDIPEIILSHCSIADGERTEGEGEEDDAPSSGEAHSAREGITIGDAEFCSTDCQSDL